MCGAFALTVETETVMVGGGNTEGAAEKSETQNYLVLSETQ